MASIRPVTQREHQIARSLGTDDWRVITPLGHGFRWRDTEMLVEKAGHRRWINSTQVTEGK